MKLSLQKGFAHVLLLVFLVAVTGVSATGYYVYDRQQDTKARQQAEKARQDETTRLAQSTKQAEELRLAEEQKKAEQTKAAEQAQQNSQTQQPVSPCNRDATMYVNSAAGLNLREGRSSSAKSMVLMPHAAAVKVGCLEGDWYSGEYSGKVGFAHKSYLATTKPQPISRITYPTNADCGAIGTTLTLYAAKSPTIGYYFGTSAAPALAYGTKITDVICARDAEGNPLGKMLYNDAYFTYDSLSKTQP